MRPAPVEQAGGDERAAFEYWASDEGLYPKAVERAGNCYKLAQTQSYWMAWQARAALAQPSLMPPDRGPWHAVKWDGGRRVDLSSDDFEHDVALTVSGDFVEGDKFRYAQELAAWMNAHLAQPSPVQAEQHWPKLEQPAKVGGVRFSAGVSSRLVVEAAQRLYEFESTPEQEAERIERLQAFREQLDPLNLAPHAEAFNEAPAEALKSDQAEAERPEVVAWQYRVTAGPQTGWSLWHPGKGEEFERSYTVERRPLMTVAQHERIVAQLHDALDESDGDRWKLRSERDAALARVAELEKQEPVATIAKVPGEDWNGLHFYRDLQGMQPGTKLYAAPVTQDQQLHDLDKQCRDDVARALGLRPSHERGFAWSYLLDSIKSCVKASEDAAQAQHSVPAYVSYTTRPAESLAGIALRQLKEESRWVEIRDINAHAFPDMQSHSYYPAGTVIKLPAAAPGKEVGHE
ncbi:LysM peptidoglycan-binding domain-containing protein [Pseudomonas aeruginosa]|uniref:LysM peptidoglycan-binding domain-containing protein n=1 Tax=Pseudomonas aeruginosa TaxID=287 RepID=UPI0015717E25|nr:hypothetical protein [Pseudomonas aeruginosa]NTT95266.1 hypothetical protein [Pseudomonas aeruginosa]